MDDVRARHLEPEPMSRPTLNVCCETRENVTCEGVLFTHMVSSHRTRDLECFAESNNTPWNPPTIHCPDRTAIAPQMFPSFSLRTALSAIPCVSDLCGVDVQ